MAPPDDRQRDAGEHDLEQVAGRSRDLAEPVERLLADRGQLGHRREESVRADQRAAVSEGEPVADRPVDERADPEDEDVLARDVSGVLHAGQARLQEGEAGLHEHDQDGGDDDPDRAGRDQEVVVLGAHFDTTFRRRGAMDECEARTQGAAVSGAIRARLRTLRRAVQRGPAAPSVVSR
jgi:hypothetical protein